MADSDDDLVVPPKAAPKPAITLDDSDDDLPAPKTAAPAGPPPPSSSNKVVLDDSDDDLLPAPPGNNNAAASPRADNSGSPTTTRPPAASLPPTSSRQSFKDPNSAAPPSSKGKGEPGSPKAADAAAAGGNDEDELAATLRRQRTYRRKKLHKEGFLFKQQPVWPYGTQKRWCVLDGRLFNYYDTQGAVKPSAILDLKGATVVLDSEEAKQPNSFGISNITSGTSGTGTSGALKGRVFIFSALNKEEMNEWVEAIRSVTAEPQSEVHWFEKMAQGTF